MCQVRPIMVWSKRKVAKGKFLTFPCLPVCLSVCLLAYQLVTSDWISIKFLLLKVLLKFVEIFHSPYSFTVLAEVKKLYASFPCPKKPFNSSYPDPVEPSIVISRIYLNRSLILSPTHFKLSLPLRWLDQIAFLSNSSHCRYPSNVFHSSYFNHLNSLYEDYKPCLSLCIFLPAFISGCVVVKALCYKPEARGFDTRWGEFFNLPNPSGRTRPWGLLSL
jgi:hypothetical protein